MKKELLLIVLLLIIGCESKQTKITPVATPDNDLIPINAPIEGVTFSGGDGSSIEQAVIIKAPNKYSGVRGELRWIKTNRPGWRFERQSVLKGGGKVLDKMIFQTPQGDLKTVFFDVTDFSGKK